LSARQAFVTPYIGIFWPCSGCPDFFFSICRVTAGRRVLFPPSRPSDRLATGFFLCFGFPPTQAASAEAFSYDLTFRLPLQVRETSPPIRNAFSPEDVRRSRKLWHSSPKTGPVVVLRACLVGPPACRILPRVLFYQAGGFCHVHGNFLFPPSGQS